MTVHKQGAVGTPELLSREEERCLLQAAVTGKGEEQKVARERLVTQNKGLVVHFAQRFLNRGVPFDDLCQEGNIGLLLAIERFDLSRNLRFATYAGWWVRERMIQAVRAEQWRQSDLDWSVLEPEDGAEDDEADPILLELDLHSAEDCILQQEVAEKVRLALQDLPPREIEVVTLRFGLDGGGVRTLQEVADVVGVSREGARKAVGRALRVLREHEALETLNGFA